MSSYALWGSVFPWETVEVSGASEVTETAEVIECSDESRNQKRAEALKMKIEYLMNHENFQDPNIRNKLWEIGTYIPFLMEKHINTVATPSWSNLVDKVRNFHGNFRVGSHNKSKIQVFDDIDKYIWNLCEYLQKYVDMSVFWSMDFVRDSIAIFIEEQSIEAKKDSPTQLALANFTQRMFLPRINDFMDRINALRSIERADRNDDE